MTEDALYDALLRLPPGAMPTITLEDFLTRPQWHQDAACRGLGADVFFIPRGGNSAPAKAICAGCPVAEQCRESVLEHGDTFGIWAGQVAQQHHRERHAA